MLQLSPGTRFRFEVLEKRLSVGVVACVFVVPLA